MTWYFRGILATCIVSFLSLGLIVQATTPADASPIIKTAFFISLCIGIWSVVSLAIYALTKERSARTLLVASAYGFLFAFTAIMALLSYKILG